MAPHSIVWAALLAAAGLILPAVAQLSGPVGPITTISAKRSTKICNIMDYGGVASASVDNGGAILSAWKACVSGGEILIPKGDYGMVTWVKLAGGKGVSINLEGTIHRIGRDLGNMIIIEHSTDVEFYSASSTGAIQGYGYRLHREGIYIDAPRPLRFWDVHSFSAHDFILVDSPSFHLVVDNCTDGELYNMVIHGGYAGALDALDVMGKNIWVHDIEASNKDECVAIKDPSENILVEQIHCNWSGGCAMGSLATNISIHNIEFNHIYTHHSNQMFMVKSNGGSGHVSNITLKNFMGYANGWTLDFNTRWSRMSVAAGNGINYTDFTFSNWTGTCKDGVQRGPVRMLCPPAVPCTRMNIDNFHVWTEIGNKVLHVCENAYGVGSCLNTSSTTSVPFNATRTITVPGNFSYATLPNELKAGFDVNRPIPIPVMPSMFFPGRMPIKPILNGVGSMAPPKKHVIARIRRGTSPMAPGTHFNHFAP